MISALSHLCCDCLRLPHQRHIPGSQSVADLVHLSAIVKHLPETICANKWRRNLPYRYGWFLFANQYYWEAHEVWEAVWLRANVNSRERFLLQGLIQLANAGLKFRQNKEKAGTRILELAIYWFDAAYPPKLDATSTDILMGISKESAQLLLQNMYYKTLY